MQLQTIRERHNNMARKPVLQVERTVERRADGKDTDISH